MHNKRTYFLLVLGLTLSQLCPTQGQSVFCETVSLSGIQSQTSRGGTYNILTESQFCNSTHAAYQQEGGINYLFYLETSLGWKGWVVGSQLCQNLAGIVVEYSSATDPTKVPSSVTWYELTSRGWVGNSNLEVTCGTGLSTIAILGIVFAVLVLISIAAVVIVCLIHKSNNKPVTPVNGEDGVGTAPGGRTLHPNVWTSNAAFDLRYQRPPDPCPAYSSHTQSTGRNSTTTTLGPPPSYQESLNHGTNPRTAATQDSSRSGRSTTTRVTVASSNNHGDDTSPPGYSQEAGDERVFSPPPLYMP